MEGIQHFKDHVRCSKRLKNFEKDAITSVIDKLGPIIKEVDIDDRDAGYLIVTNNGHVVILITVPESELEPGQEYYVMEIYPSFNEFNLIADEVPGSKLINGTLAYDLEKNRLTNDEEAQIIIKAMDGVIKGGTVRFKLLHEVALKNS